MQDACVCVRGGGGRLLRDDEVCVADDAGHDDAKIVFDAEIGASAIGSAGDGELGGRGSLRRDDAGGIADRGMVNTMADAGSQAPGLVNDFRKPRIV
jgi:hypothetical protein